MGGHLSFVARRRTRRPAVWACLVAPLALVACSDDEPSSDADATASAPVTASTVDGGTRPVPTVPPSTIEGQVGEEGGVVDASPTIAPAPVDPDAPTTTVVPPTTELVGDPQPNPDSTSPPPPPPTTVEGGPDACEQLVPFGMEGVISDTIGVTTTAESVDAAVCRYSSGAFVVEVHFVSVAEVRDDWFTREGVEPVAEVGGEAVGLSSYLAPGSAAADGYTVAVDGGARGVIVAATGNPDARLAAAQVAIFAAQAA